MLFPLPGSLFPEVSQRCLFFTITAKQAGTIALQAGVKKLALTHFWPEEYVNTYVQEASQVFENTVGLYEGYYFII